MKEFFERGVKARLDYKAEEALRKEKEDKDRRDGLSAAYLEINKMSEMVRSYQPRSHDFEPDMRPEGLFLFNRNKGDISGRRILPKPWKVELVDDNDRVIQSANIRDVNEMQSFYERLGGEAVDLNT